MTQAFRISDGTVIDRTKTVTFTFDDKLYHGFTGDTLASALLANGVHLMGRSFKYHRPRGVLAAGSEEPNALVTVSRDKGRTTPNLRATQVEIYEGLTAKSQNRFPSLRFDVGAINDLLSPLFGAGFYYKTFMASQTLWTHLFEPLIRRAAGLGHAPTDPDPDHYANQFAHCDVLVIGGGAAGLSAALSAGRSGARIILADEQAQWGGGLLSERTVEIDGQQAQIWLAQTLRALQAMPNVKLLARTTAFGYFQQNFIGMVERLTDHLPHPAPRQARERLWQVRAKQVILATGAIERPLVFCGNDRPGVMLASAARIYLNSYGVLVGKSILVFTADDKAYQAAIDLHHAGAVISAIVDLRDNPQGTGFDRARELGIPILTSHVVIETFGRLRINAAALGRIEPDGTVTPIRVENCDCLLMSGGFTPSVHLFSQSRGKLAYDDKRQIYIPGQSVQDEWSVGASRGTFGLQECLQEGFSAGCTAAQKAGFRVNTPHPSHVTGDVNSVAGFTGAVPHSKGHGYGKAFVDFQNDVKSSDIISATQEGFKSIEHVKRYTTTGMATDQGKTSNMNALALAANALGRQIPEVGLTTFRMPYTPVTFGTIAGHARGDLFDPVRKTVIHDWAQSQGAVFEDVGLWKRAWYFPHKGETMQQAILRECKTVRNNAGLFDASTLGKIEIVGPDAAEFLNRIYTNSWTKLDVGRCRYGLMLNEQGFVMDDGVIGRLARDRFHVTTTTSGAPRVLAHMEDYLQTEFPELDVWLTSTTEQWAVIAVQGPQTRAIIAPFVEGIDLSTQAMPHMSVRTGRICGVETRLFRVSFTGELGFEVNVPAGYGRMVWEALWQEAQKHNACAYGTETMHVLRAEKGFIIVGQDTDGTVTPYDLGMDWAIGKAKPDFVGKRSLLRPDLVKPDRPQFVGLLTQDPQFVPDEGAQIITTPNPEHGSSASGFVTSAYMSATLGRSIAVGLVASGRNRLGEIIYITRLDGKAVPAILVDPVFYDKEGVRLDA
jgi:sarcosine oxidase subunit alpha